MNELRRLWGRNLRNLRLAHDVTQRELAANIGVHYSTVSLWESGQRVPLDSHRILLAEHFGVDVAMLFPLTKAAS